ncbi:MAG: nucleotide-binding enzyme [Alphaproteobacteria bacterium]|nr:nucleotide-binding enzyme [Alphaproteobacteria bacterium]
MSRRRKGDGRRDRLRQQITEEAARLMYAEGVGQYFDAKRIAARRLLGTSGARQLQFRPRDLPSNGEIREAMLALARRAEGEDQARRLFALRVQALVIMEVLLDFRPRLIGSVSTGHVRRGSDVDLHVFTVDVDVLTAALDAEGIGYTVEPVLIRISGGFKEYTHVHLDTPFPVELTVYDPRELRVVSRSSTDGRPIDRVDPARLEARMAEEHPAAWAAWTARREIPGLATLLAEHAGPPPGLYDGLIDLP